MECSLRIRVIGETKQCPQCRTDIPILYYVSAPPGQKLLLKLPSNCIDHTEYEAKYSVRFDSKYALECFDSYMANRCNECTKSGQRVEFGTFAELRSHMSQDHHLSFCRICCDNLNVLIKDRHVYTRETLQLHMNGKLKSEQNGFRDQECLQMGIVFVSDVELNVHKAKQHHRLTQNGSGSSRGGTIPLEFHFVHSRGGGSSSRQMQNEDNLPVEQQQVLQKPSSQTVRIVPSAQSQQQNVKIVKSSYTNPLQSTDNFPSLTTSDQQNALFVPYGAPPGFESILTTNNFNVKNKVSEQQNGILTTSQLPLTSAEQFPSLGGTSGSSNSNNTGSKTNKNTATVWGQKSNKDLFNPKKENKLNIKKEEEPKRQAFVPAPDCWPEHMLKKLKARELGLPDPEPIEPPSWLNPPKKEKKRKTKTVTAASLMNRLAATEMSELASSSSKFNSLSAYDEAKNDKKS
uniref:Uncharacterized protein n=1 Tax=Meloidogyne javanica TaxID=6303 RepID=A0A915LII1_MELJA